MLGFRDNITLATTKLRSRRIRLIVTLVVSGLLFTVLVSGSLVVRGTLASLKDFTREGFSSRFLVAVYDSPNSELVYDAALIKRAQVIEKDLIAKKTAEAKRLGIPYDAASEPNLTAEGGPDGPKQVMLNSNHPAAAQAIHERAATPSLIPTLERISKSYGHTSVYSGGRIAAYDNNAFELAPIVLGKEVKGASNMGPTEDPLASFMNDTQTLDQSLVKPFLLEGATLAGAPEAPVPILAPVDAIEKLVGLKPLSPKATSKDKLERLKEVRRKALNLPFEVCYRNQTAIDLRNLATQQATEATAGKGKADYVAPELQYATDAVACTPTYIAKDTRTVEDKALAAKLEQFKATFGAVAPQTTVLKFRVVGVLPKSDYGSAFDLTSLVSSLVTSSLGTGWFIPGQAASAHPVLSQLAASPLKDLSNGGQAYVEFANRTDQKRFLDERMCQPENGLSTKDPTAECRKDDKFFMSPYGNPLAAIYDSKEGFLKFLRIVLLVIAGISAIIMMGTVGKIIADSRKETSVFRAVGARRVDIAQIYVLYAAILASLAFLVSLTLGLIVALVIESRLSPALSMQAVLAFNSPSVDKAFHLIGFNIWDLLAIFAFAVATGLASAILPLLTNLRRNPIKDMREE